MKQRLKHKSKLLISLLSISSLSAVVLSLPISLGQNQNSTDKLNSTSLNASTNEESNTVIPSSWDSRTKGWVSPTVRNQGSSQDCWAYAFSYLTETSLLKNHIINQDNLDINPLNIDYLTNVRTTSADHLGLTLYDTFSSTIGSGGKLIYAAQMLYQHNGPTNNSGSLGTSYQYNEHPSASLTTAIQLNTISKDTNALKQAIMDYGAIGVGLNAYELTNGIQYFYLDESQTNRKESHVVTIIGWDDNIPASNFYPNKPSRNGAWIVKNSWGPNMGNNGYFYLSYDSDIWDELAIDYQKDSWDNNYYYDGDSSFSSASSSNNQIAANIYPVSRASYNINEQLKAVGFQIVGNDVTVTAKVYANLKDVKDAAISRADQKPNDPTNGELVAQKTVTYQLPGIYTMDFDQLDKPIYLERGSYFSVVIETSNKDGNSGVATDSETYSLNDMSYFYDGTSWKDASLNNPRNRVFRIKAFTDNVDKANSINNYDLKYANLRFADNYYQNKAFYRYMDDDSKLPKLVVTYDSKTLTQGVDYTIEYKDEVNTNFSTNGFNSDYIDIVGAKEYIVKGIGQYSGTNSIDLPILVQTSTPPGIDKIGTLENRQIKINVTNNVKKYSDISLPNGWEWVYPDKEIKYDEIDGSTVNNYVKYTSIDSNLFTKNMYDVVLNKSGTTSDDTTNHNSTTGDNQENASGSGDSSVNKGDTENDKNTNNSSDNNDTDGDTQLDHNSTTGDNQGNASSDDNIKVDISAAKISFEQNQNEYYYTGGEIKPEIKVLLDGKELVEGTDYRVSYSNNADVGVASAIIQGINKYDGESTLNFKIVKSESDNSSKSDNNKNDNTLIISVSVVCAIVVLSLVIGGVVYFKKHKKSPI